MEFGKEKWNERLQGIFPEVENLFYKGNIELLVDDAPKLAIVGSRRVTDYGVRVIEKWMPELVAAGVTIVSGFMYGADQLAHKVCVDNGGKTIAVLGWGIDRRLAGNDVEIYEKIIETDGLIVSEFGGIFPASRWTFPQRNRIVAGISDAVLVVEAAMRSGSLITARLANRFQKPLFAVPGQVTSKVAEGTNEIIKSGKGRMVVSATDILTEMGIGGGQMKLRINEKMDPMLHLLQDSDRSVDEISRLMRLTVPEVLGKLTTYSLRGLVRENNGKISLM